MPYTDRGNGPTDPVTNAPMLGTEGTVAALGTIQGDAAPIPYALNKVTGADAAKGVILPAASDSRLTTRVVVINAAAAVLKVWPALGGTINGGSANAAVSLAANTIAEFFLFGTDTWWGNEAVQA